jgi:hypothetical protein
MNGRRWFAGSALVLGIAMMTVQFGLMVEPAKAGGGISPAPTTCTNNPDGDKTTCSGGSSTDPEVDYCGAKRGEVCNPDPGCCCRNTYPPDRSSVSCVCTKN